MKLNMNFETGTIFSDEFELWLVNHGIIYYIVYGKEDPSYVYYDIYSRIDHITFEYRETVINDGDFINRCSISMDGLKLISEDQLKIQLELTFAI